MTESSHVALKLSELIRNHFQGVTKQKKIVELLKAQGVEVSEGLLSRLFNGFYEVRLDSRLFAELSQLLAPEESKEAFWDRLLKDYNPNTALNESIKIGLSLKSFWARPFVTMLINKSLPEPFEIVYGQRVQKKFNEYFQVRERTFQKFLTAKYLDVPHTNTSFDGVKREDTLSDVIPTGAFYDRFKSRTATIDSVSENDEWLLSQSLQELLKDDKLQIIAAPDSIKINQSDDLIPICRICSGVVSQMLIFEKIEKKPNHSTTNASQVKYSKKYAYPALIEEINTTIEYAFDSLLDQSASVNDFSKEQKRKKELLKYKQFFSERLKKVFDVRELEIRDMKYDNTADKKDTTHIYYTEDVTYNPYLRNEINDEKVKEEYLDRIINCFDLAKIKNAKENGSSNYFWVRSIYNTLSDELLAEFVSILKSRKEKSSEKLDIFNNLIPPNDPEIQKLYDAEKQFYKDENEKWSTFYELFSNRISRPICMYSEEFLYKKQIKERIVDDILVPGDDSQPGGYFALVGFIPFADKILWDIVKYFNRSKSEKSLYELKINRFNLSNLFCKRITTNLYVRKEYLKKMIENNQLHYIDRLIDQLKKSVQDFQSNDILKRQLAFHHFYFEDTDRPNEFRRMNELFHQDTKLMKLYLEEYDSSEKINEFTYTITRTDEYARFLEEMLSEK